MLDTILRAIVHLIIVAAIFAAMHACLDEFNHEYIERTECWRDGRKIVDRVARRYLVQASNNEVVFNRGNQTIRLRIDSCVVTDLGRRFKKGKSR